MKKRAIILFREKWLKARLAAMQKKNLFQIFQYKSLQIYSEHLGLALYVHFVCLSRLSFERPIVTLFYCLVACSPFVQTPLQASFTEHHSFITFLSVQGSVSFPFSHQWMPCSQFPFSLSPSSGHSHTHVPTAAGDWAAHWIGIWDFQLISHIIYQLWND